MDNGQPRRSYQILIRMWPEDMGGGELEWRGKALDIDTGNSIYFRDWPGLMATLQKMLEQPRAVPGQPRTDV